MDKPAQNTLAAKAKTDKPSLSALAMEFKSNLVELVRQSRIHRNDQPDAVQECLLQLMRCVNTYDPVLGDFQNYLISNVRKLLLRFYQKRTPVPGLVATDIPERQQTEDTSGDVEESLSKLPPLHQNLIRDHYGIGVQERSVNQIAAHRRLSNEKVKRTLQEAMRLLRGGV